MYFTPEEVREFRNQTPGCSSKIHLNNAGASLMPDCVVAAIQEHIELEKMEGGYEAASLKAQEIESFYTSAGSLLGCSSDLVAFTANATDSFSRAISSIDFMQGDIIVTSNEDYASNQITYLSLRKRFGIRLVRAKSLPTGGIDLHDLETCLSKYRPKLVAITHIPTNSGLVQPVTEIGNLCQQVGTLYLIDACQSIGQMRLQVEELKCDFLSVTARKFLRGPRGAGFLYVSRRALDLGLEPLFIDMRGADWMEPDSYVQKNDAKRFEDWEFAYALVLGTKAAIDYLLAKDMGKIEQQVKYLAQYTRDELQKVPGVTTFDKGQSTGGIVTFRVAGSDAQTIHRALANRRINVSISNRAGALIDYDEKGVDWTIRASPHYFNTLEEINYLIDGIRELRPLR
jgi:selenocysteine lyase/cysteine desulfurase